MTTTTEPLALYRIRAEAFAEVLDGVGDWSAPTPCEGWSAREVVAHVVETEREFLERHDLGLADAPDLGDPPGAWRRHAASVAGVLADDGVAERGFDGYFGPTTIGETLAEFYAWDLVIHGWDVARASEQEYAVSDDEVAALSAGADGWGDALYSEGVCAGPVDVPVDAPPFDRLLGRLGRDPGWTP